MAKSSENLDADSILREFGHLSAVIRRQTRPVSGGASKSDMILVHLSMHEDAMAEGFAQRSLSQIDVAEFLGIRPQSVGPILVQLEEEGLIRRVPYEKDRRALLVELTDKGRDAASSAREVQKRIAEQTLSVLTDEERVQFASIILKLNAAL